MIRYPHVLLLWSILGSLLFLSGCLYDNPPSGPSRDVDTWLTGQWKAGDKSGHTYSALITHASSDHYRITLNTQGGATQEFDAWISRVDDFSILTLKSLNEGPSLGKYALYHYELLSPSPPPPGGIGATRIRLSELQLDESCRSLDSFHLRKAIRSALKAGTLLAPYDVVAERKLESQQEAAYSADADYLRSFLVSGKSKTGGKPVPTLKEVPGSVIWTKTGGVTLKGEAF